MGAFFFWDGGSRTLEVKKKIEHAMAIPVGAPILVIREPWLGLILDGEKTLEIRGSSCRKPRDSLIYLSASGSGAVSGHAVFVECIGPMSDDEWEMRREQHRVSGPATMYSKIYGWRLSNPTRIAPVPYLVKPGAITWRRFEPVSDESM